MVAHRLVGRKNENQAGIFMYYYFLRDGSGWRGYYPDSFDDIPIGRYDSNLSVGMYQLYLVIPIGRYDSNLSVGMSQTYR